jgi:hypothetical protein
VAEGEVLVEERARSRAEAYLFSYVCSFTSDLGAGEHLQVGIVGVAMLISIEL